MNAPFVFRICRPCYRPAEPGFFRLHFETAALVRAASEEDAIRKAKRLGYFAPIVERSKEELQ